jgi:hypothetical protein
MALAGLTFLVHLAFVGFVVAGGLFAGGRPKLAIAHLAALAWGAYVSLANEVCPLTPLENWLLRRAGAAGYPEGFLEHYVVPVLYPGALTPLVQRLLGAGVVLLNVFVYARVVRGTRARRYGLGNTTRISQ